MTTVSSLFRPSAWRIALAPVAAAPVPVSTTALPLTVVAGQSQLQWLARGTVLHIHRGEMVLEPVPRFLAGLTWRQPRHLPRGQVWVAQREGWVRLTAGPRSCQLSLRAPATSPTF